MELHEHGLQKYGGAAGFKDPDCPEGSLAAAWNACEYGEIGDSLPHIVFAAYALYYLVKNHCFTDGNKRIGWLVMAETLATADLEVAATDDEAIEFVLKVASGDTKIEGVIKWVQSRVVPMATSPRSALESER